LALMHRMNLLSNRLSCSVAHSAVNSFNINLNLIGIWEFIQAKSHTVAQCVANHLLRGPVYQSTKEKFMLKKLMQKPSVNLNMTLQYCRTVANSDVNSLETCLKTDENSYSFQLCDDFFSLSFSLVTHHFT
jgi:uncharacterized membrane protein YkgB